MTIATVSGATGYRHIDARPPLRISKLSERRRPPTNDFVADGTSHGQAASELADLFEVVGELGPLLRSINERESLLQVDAAVESPSAVVLETTHDDARGDPYPLGKLLDMFSAIERTETDE